jgi:hypothetical protein
MQFTRFGRTGLSVSRLCIGTGTFGKQIDEAELFRIFDAAASGVNFIDTADNFPGGSDPSEIERVPQPVEWALIGAKPVVTTDPQLCFNDTFFISEEIPPVTTYENEFADQVRRQSDDASWERDALFIDERFLMLHMCGKGLVVFSVCPHAGIINVLHHARASFLGLKLHAAMGGFHLSGPTKAIIPETVRDFRAFGLDLIIPAHCTAWRALNAWSVHMVRPLFYHPLWESGSVYDSSECHTVSKLKLRVQYCTAFGHHFRIHAWCARHQRSQLH